MYFLSIHTGKLIFEKVSTSILFKTIENSNVIEGF